jgi:FkbM family methyltransferase
MHPKVLWKMAKRARPIFSQFGEDVALTRLLHPQSSGVYVDVGANHPFDGSNTAYLYLKGWSGLAIDPNPIFAEQFRKVRPRDIYLTEGASLSPGALTYYEFEENKFNTLSDERSAQLVREGKVNIRQSSIPCRPLAESVRTHLKGKHIDLLSVDCEGLDLEVLKSAELDAMTPTVIIIEDFSQYLGFRDHEEEGELPQFLRSMNYAPIYQCAWSAIYVSRNWRDLPKTGAYDPPRDPNDYMPNRLEAEDFRRVM